jgi:anti-sigma factor RsiW
MNGCYATRTKFTEYLDGRLSGREMQSVAAHLEGCRDCAGEWKSLEQAQSSLAALGPAPSPKDLLLRINVAISHERARRRQSPFHALNLAWRNTVGPFLLQASAGFASAVFLLGTVIVLVSMFAQPETVQATADGEAAAPLVCVTEKTRYATVAR